MAIRVAVGAGRWQLLRQLSLENLSLAVAGGSLGVLLGRWATSALLASAADRLQWASFELDARVVAFSVGVTVATVFLFGWAPALFALGGNVREAMHTAAGGATASPRGRRTLFLLVGAEFALASVLLVCGGLMLRAWERVRGVDPGFRADQLLTFSLALPNASYPDDPKRLAFWERLAERAKALPGVVAAGGISCAPFGNCHWGNFYEAEGRPLAPGAPNPVVLQRYASADYFQALGPRLKSGRFLEPRDGRDEAERVVVVNETFLRTFWPGEKDAVGKRVRGQSRSGDAPWYTVVGLVGDVKHYGLEREMRPGLYFPLPERPTDNLTLVLRTRGEPQDLAAGARALVRELDPDLAVFRVRSMEAAVADSLRTRASYSRLLWAFAGLALLLALAGAYGVTSYLVTQRVRELGIRIALGARGADVVRSVLLGSLRVVSVGVVLGVAVSLGATRLLATLLFGVPPHDLVVLGGAVALLLAAAATANALPAWRASRVDPMSTLRAE
jgi:predicted permease